MKKIYILLTLMIVVSLGAKKTTYTTKVVPLLSEQTSYLNGGARADFSGMSRTTFEIDLPPNTIEWYYTFYSTPNQKNTSGINLIGQLTKLVDPTASALSDLTSSIISPTGSGACSIYLLDENHRTPFMNKVDRKGISLNQYTDGSRDNFINGTVRITKTINTGTYFIGLRNNSMTQGTYVHIEAAAIVEEESH